MYPHLLKIGPVVIPSYGVLVALGLILGVGLSCRLAVKASLDRNRVYLLAWFAILAGLFGARLLHVFAQGKYFLEQPLAIFRIWEGWAFLGAPIAGLFVVIWYTRRHHMPIWKVLDVLTPSLAVDLVFARVGCLLAGCCHGKPTGSAFGVTLTTECVDPLCRGVPLHPTQLYEAVCSLLLLFWLLRLFKSKSFDGQVFLSFFIIYPVFRSVIECYRGDTIRGFVIPGILSTSQFLSIMMLIPAVALYVFRRKNCSFVIRHSSPRTNDECQSRL
jgi:phosphatidylglycerol---prolipoprotein diacylglyceryl transferase